MKGFGSEQAFLAAIDRHFPNTHPRMELGRGDDCAVLAMPGRACLSADLFVEDVHFRRSYFTPQDIGHKALAVNISDVAAMGARPLGFALQIFGPADTPAEFWEGLLEGMAELADEVDSPPLPLVGGDLSLGPCVGLAVTIWGAAGESGRFLHRGQTRPGDILFVVGSLGLARVGFTLLEERGRVAMAACPAACAAHLRPACRVQAGLALADLPGVRGLMDISDGLASDLPRFLAPGQGAKLDLTGCIHPEVAAFVASQGAAADEVAFLGGEDYGLLGAADPAILTDLLARVPECRVIGHVTDRPGITLSGRAAPRQGFDHFGG